MKTKEQVLEYIQDGKKIIPNVLHVFLSQCSYEESKPYLKKEVTEQIFKKHISKTPEDLEDFLNTLRNSISSLFITITNDLLIEKSNVITFVDKILFLKQFLWYLDMEDIGDLILFETISVDQIQKVKDKIKEVDTVFNFVEYEKYLVDVKNILKLKYRLTHKRGGKVTDEKLISYIPKGFMKKQLKNGVVWKKKLPTKKGSPKEEFVIREVKDLEKEQEEIDKLRSKQIKEDLEKS